MNDVKYIEVMGSNTRGKPVPAQVSNGSRENTKA